MMKRILSIFVLLLCFGFGYTQTVYPIVADTVKIKTPPVHASSDVHVKIFGNISFKRGNVDTIYFPDGTFQITALTATRLSNWNTAYSWGDWHSSVAPKWDSIVAKAYIVGTYVPLIRTINGYPLTSDVTLNKSDVGLSNVPNVDATNPANISQSPSYRFATDVEKATWNAKEPAISLGNTSDYYRGDKTFQPLNKSAVGLPNVDNTSDVNKPVSIATQSALNLKFNLTDTASAFLAYKLKDIEHDAAIATKQPTLVSGTNIKTINSISLLGAGDISVSSVIGFTPENVANKAVDFTVLNNTRYPSVSAVKTLVDASVANGNTAFGWGNHASFGYLTSYTETDPTIYAWAKAATKPSYGWTEIGSRPTLLSQFTNDLGNYGGFLTTETDPIYTASSWYTTTNNSSNWNTAYGWGNHTGLYYTLGSTVANSTLWGGMPYTGTLLSTAPTYIMSYLSGTWRPSDAASVAAFISGQNFNTSGTAAYATYWGGFAANFNVAATTMDYLLVRESGAGIMKVGSAALVASFLSGQSMNIAGYATSETLATVTGRGNTTTTMSWFNNGVGFDQAGVRSWTLAPSSGNLLLSSGDGLGIIGLTATQLSMSGRGHFSKSGQTSYTTAALEVYTGDGAASEVGISFHRGGQSAGFLSHGPYGGLRFNGDQLLLSSNFNSYAPTLTGGGASGTWGISITGNADGATKLWSISHPSTYYLTNTWNGSYWRLSSNHGSGVSVEHASTASYASTAPWSGLSGVPSSLVYYSGFTLDANTIPYNSDGFSYALNAPYTGPLVDLGAANYELQFSAAYTSSNIGFRTRNGDAGTWNGWRNILHESNFTSYAYAIGSTVANSTLWNGYAINLATYGSNAGDFLNYDNSLGIIKPFSTAQIQTKLGITGGPFLPLTGGALTGGLNGTSADFSNLIIDRNSEFFRSIPTVVGSAQYQTWYNSAGTRRGYYGFGGTSSNVITLANETGGGNEYVASDHYFNNLVRAPYFSYLGSSVSTDNNFGIYFDGPSLSPSYGIYRQSGAWTAPFPDLYIAFHTGIKIGAHYDYGGTRFYNNSDMATMLFSIGETDQNIRMSYGGSKLLTRNIVNIEVEALQASYFGYSGSYAVLKIGDSRTQRSISFGVDLTSNPAGTFNGDGREYIWRNIGNFITPNASNNGYNNLFSWDNVGSITLGNHLSTGGYNINAGSGSIYAIAFTGNLIGNATTATSTTLLSALSSYGWSNSSVPTTYQVGIQNSFVSSTEGFPNYGSVMTMRTYSSSGGGVLQLYTPYGDSYGGTSLKFRNGNYPADAFTAWKTIIDETNIGSQSVTYATNSTRLYASDGVYVYGGGAPYYAALNYNSTSNYWEFKMNPATPADIWVSKSATANNAILFDSYASSEYLRKGASGYYQASAWIQINQGTGLYWPNSNYTTNYGGTYVQISPNYGNTSYGSLNIYGRQNSYAGIVLVDGNNTTWMHDNGGNGGMYSSATGWQYYWNVGQSGLGIGSSTVQTGYKLTVSGNTYLTGAVFIEDGIVDHNAYVGSPLNYLDGTGVNAGGGTGRIGYRFSVANATNANSGVGLDLVNNTYANNVYSPIISFSSRTLSGAYNNTYAAIYGEHYSSAADGNWSTGAVRVATTSVTGAGVTSRVIINYNGLATVNGGSIRTATNFYADQDYGYGLIGLYSATRYQGVFAMGESYKLPADGSTPGSLYGIAWTHSNVGGQSAVGLGHQALFMGNGYTTTAIGTGIWTSGNINFNGGYLYANRTLANTSGNVVMQVTDTWLRLNPNNDFSSGVYIANELRVDGWNTNANGIRQLGSVSANNGFGFYFGTAGETDYVIRRRPGAWVQPLEFAFYTGIRIGADYNYGGTRFYNSSNLTTQLFSIGDGDQNVKAANNMYATNYYTYGAAGKYYASYNGSGNYDGMLQWNVLQLGNNGDNFIVAGDVAGGGSLKVYVNNTNRVTGSNPNGILAITVNNAGKSFFHDAVDIYYGLSVGSGMFTVASNGTLTTANSATIGGNVTAAAFYQSSDIRLKNVISQVEDMIIYTWKDQRDKLVHYGYSAQEKEINYPYQVSTNTDGIKSVNYIEIHTKKINDLEIEVSELKNLINQLLNKQQKQL